MYVCMYECVFTGLVLYLIIDLFIYIERERDRDIWISCQ